MKTKLSIIVLFFITSFTTLADEWAGARNIIYFGCHKNDGTCFIGIDGNPVTGATGCSSNELRFNVKTDPNGKQTFALVALAKATNKKMGFSISGCYADQSPFPTFSYSQVE